MIDNLPEAVSAEIARMAERNGVDAETFVAGLKIFIADRVVAEAAEVQVAPSALIDDLTSSLKDLIAVRGRRHGI